MINRKQTIINIIKKERSIGINDLLIGVNSNVSKKVSKITVIRDLGELIKDNLIIKVGKGPAVKYQISASNIIFENINIQKYFYHEPEERKARNVFNFEIFKLLKNVSIFSDSEMEKLNGLNSKYQSNIMSLPSEIIDKEFERLMIELSWKSSKIEGNTYDLLETEFLIKENKEARGHTKKEAQMILNHKDALNYIKGEQIKSIDFSKIKKVHHELTKQMGISNDVRNKPVGITGTIYRPLQLSSEIKDAIVLLSDLVNGKENIFEKAILLNLIIAYIQPFNDGNKRTSRLMGNAVLMANNYCPLSFRSIDELEYKKAVILFYEQNNLRYFKKLFIEQYQFAVENYFKSEI